jgi:hypothetical protein
MASFQGMTDGHDPGSGDVERGGDDAGMDELGEMLGIPADYDYEMPRPRWCCGKLAPIGTVDVTQRCSEGRCVEEFCECGAYHCGWGPVRCACGR